MAGYLANPPRGQRLYGLISFSDGGVGSNATGGIAAAAYSGGLDNYLEEGDTTPTVAPYSHDNLVAAGVKRFVLNRLFGDYGGGGYVIGNAPAGYPGGPFAVACQPNNQVVHLAKLGSRAWLDQIVPAFDTDARKGQVYEYVLYSGMVAAAAGTTAAALDAHSEIAEALDAIQVYDAESALDKTVTSLPHVMHVERNFARGILGGTEALLLKSLAQTDGWKDRIAYVVTDHTDAEARYQEGGAASFELFDTSGRFQTIVLIANNGPTVAARIALMVLWMSRGAHVAMDFGGFTEPEIVDAVAKAAASIDRLSGGRLILGVGAGWNEEEMEDHGTDPARRFGVLRERVEAAGSWRMREGDGKPLSPREVEVLRLLVADLEPGFGGRLHAVLQDSRGGALPAHRFAAAGIGRKSVWRMTWTSRTRIRSGTCASPSAPIAAATPGACGSSTSPSPSWCPARRSTRR